MIKKYTLAAFVLVCSMAHIIKPMDENNKRKEQTSEQEQQGAGKRMRTEQQPAVASASSSSVASAVSASQANDADINAKDNRGITKLHDAVGKNKVSEVLNLLAHGADINATTNDAFTPLMLAAWLGHTAIVEVLLTEGAQTNQKDKRGWTALHHVAQTRHTEIAQFLIEGTFLAERADINATNNDGATPLMIAADFGALDVVRLLLTKGADARKLNRFNLTAYDHVLIALQKLGQPQAQENQMIINQRNTFNAIYNLFMQHHANITGNQILAERQQSSSASASSSSAAAPIAQAAIAPATPPSALSASTQAANSASQETDMPASENSSGVFATEESEMYNSQQAQEQHVSMSMARTEQNVFETEQSNSQMMMSTSAAFGDFDLTNENEPELFEQDQLQLTPEQQVAEEKAPETNAATQAVIAPVAPYSSGSSSSVTAVIAPATGSVTSTSAASASSSSAAAPIGDIWTILPQVIIDEVCVKTLREFGKTAQADLLETIKNKLKNLFSLPEILITRDALINNVLTILKRHLLDLIDSADRDDFNSNLENTLRTLLRRNDIKAQLEIIFKLKAAVEFFGLKRKPFDDQDGAAGLALSLQKIMKPESSYSWSHFKNSAVRFGTSALISLSLHALHEKTRKSMLFASAPAA